MKNQRFNLLTTLIVSALHPNEPQPAGTKWEPTNVIDIQEANELVLANYAEKIDADKSHTVTPTWLQRQDEAKRKAAEEVVSEPEPDSTPDGGSDDDLTDDELALVLEGNVEQVKAELDGLTVEQLKRLDALEGAEGAKQRKGVTDAIADAISALENPQE